MDIYFLNNEKAYKQAMLQETFGEYNNLQICYYSGDKLDDAPINLIHVKIEEIYEYFSETSNRIPEAIDSGDMGISSNDKELITNYIKKALSNAHKKRTAFGLLYQNEILKMKPNFSEPLRFIFIASRIEPKVQKMAKKMANVLKQKGFEVFISKEENSMQSWGQSTNNTFFAWHLKNILDFKPHCIINFNAINNEFLPKKVFNFIFIEDQTKVSSIKKKDLRKKDFIFTDDVKQNNRNLKDNLVHIKKNIFLNKTKSIEKTIDKILKQVI